MNDDFGAAVSAVPASGYRWWYLDGLSRDGRRGFTAIFLVGSVFSPWAWARARRGEAVPPLEHLGLHLALYEDGREVAWAMSEYAGEQGTERDVLRIGGSELRLLPDGSVEARFEERTAPPFWSRLGLGRPMSGRVRLGVGGVPRMPVVEIGRAGETVHSWQIRVPHGPIEVEFDRPGFSFSGSGYHDGNWGGGRLEDAFRRWSWARFHDGELSRVLYAVEPRGGTPRGFIVGFAGAAPVEVTADLPARFGELEPTGWGLRAPRGFGIGEGSDAHVVRWLDRTPFYARYVARMGGSEGVGEYLDLDRFGHPTVQFLLRWRGQRRSG